MSGLVPCNLSLDDFCADFGSCESWDDYVLGDAAEGRGRGAADFGQVIAKAPDDFFDDADFAQATELPGVEMETVGRAAGRDRRAARRRC